MIDNKALSVFSFMVDQAPVPLARPRFARGHAYNNQVEYQRRVHYELLSQRHAQGLYKPLEEPVSVEFVFFMYVPTSLSKIKQAALLGRPHPNKPDLDNLIKMYLDCMQNALLVDDKLVVKLVAAKIYDQDPRTEIIIERMQ